MPLSSPVARTPLHRREIRIDGFEREDGLFEVEAHLADTKPFELPNAWRGPLPPGERLHGMAIRIIFDGGMLIHHCEAAMDATPFEVCPTAAPNFARLKGLSMKAGFLRAAQAEIGGTAGCTHLRELLQQVATTAYQTLAPRRIARMEAEKAPPPANLLNTCLAWGEDSPMVRARWPDLPRPDGKAV
jgi:hypothetical protein